MSGQDTKKASMQSRRLVAACAALTAYSDATRMSLDDPDILGDLLTDLMHWASYENFDFNLALHRALSHFEDECSLTF